MYIRIDKHIDVWLSYIDGCNVTIQQITRAATKVIVAPTTTILRPICARVVRGMSVWSKSLQVCVRQMNVLVCASACVFSYMCAFVCM